MNQNRPEGFSRLVLGAVALTVLAALLMAAAGLGSRWGWWHFRTGFWLLGASAYLAIAAAAVSLIALVVILLRPRRRGWSVAVLSLIGALALVYLPWSWRQRADTVPPIHDISTDTDNPPVFVAIVPLRADAKNPVEYGGPEVAAQQRDAYPDIAPIQLDVPPQRAFQQALDAARGMGWDIVDASADEGRIEATDRTTWFGFKDDVVIRVVPAPGGSRVDVRSLSRIGGSDVGTNAARIREYAAALQS